MGGILKVDPNPFKAMSSLGCYPNHITYECMVAMSSDGGTTEEMMHRSSVRQALAAGMTVVGELPIAEIPDCLWNWNDEPVEEAPN